jgi:hypothetical protein
MTTSDDDLEQRTAPRQAHPVAIRGGPGGVDRGRLERVTGLGA